MDDVLARLVEGLLVDRAVREAQLMDDGDLASLGRNLGGVLHGEQGEERASTADHYRGW